jgi:hypothetical protein
MLLSAVLTLIGGGWADIGGDSFVVFNIAFDMPASIATSLVLATLLFAQAQETVTSLAKWAVRATNLPALTVPALVRRALAPDLEYADGDVMRGVAMDLNGDGTSDLLVRSADSLCGSGGCVLAVVDGATRRDLGHLFGSLLIVRADQAERWPLLDTYQSLSATSARLTTYAMRGGVYHEATARVVEGAAADDLRARLADVPLFPQPARER